MAVRAWQKLGEEDSPIRYYKAKGATNSDVQEKSKKSDFELTDFLLVFQTKLQSQIIAANPRTLCVDATHGVTGYSYYLLTLLVIDIWSRFSWRLGHQ